MLINQYIKNVDFHNITTTFDNLYKDSKSNKIFTKLVDLISSESNILLAYKNIKESKNNQIIGIDNKTIEYIDSLSIQELQKIIVSKTNDYKPKPIKKIEISNISGKIRPLGVPCIIDRLFQQCIRQVLEPICEAKFYNYSYGFRPNRTINHAIARTYFLMQKNKLSYCVNIDIEGIFEKIDHEILIKQMWNLGIQDKKLLSIIKTMLNTKIVLPNKSRITEVTGCYQTGILAPLLINIVLNDLDWWIATQWSDFETKKNYERERTHNGKIYIDKSNKYTELKKTSNLKEMYIVRYAEEFKIFCRNYSDAKKIYVAITQWLKIRLKLDVNEENSNIINLRQKYIDFLGFKIKLKKKSNKWVVQSHINDLSLQQIKLKLVNIIKEISKSNSKKTFYELLNQYNATVLGIHQFYSIATDISIDLQHLGLELERIIYNRLGNSYKIEKIGNFETNSIIKKNYEKSKQMRFINGRPLIPIAYVKTKPPTSKIQEETPYSVLGRALINNGSEKYFNVNIVRYLMLQELYDSTIEYKDNRISLYCAQNGKCAITGKILNINDIHCHHKIPKKDGGTDEYTNLIILDKDIHILVHAKDIETIQKYISLIKNDKQLNKINNLRRLCGLTNIETI